MNLIIDGLALINQHATVIFLLGMAGVVIFNFWKLVGDRKLACNLALRSSAPVRLKTKPKVSILVAAWNEAAIIEDHLRSIQTLNYPNLEYVLCAGGQDGTLILAQKYNGKNIRVIEQRPGDGKQRALQCCLEVATGEVIFLTDADCLLNNEAFLQTLSPIINDQETVATGTSSPMPKQRRNPFVLQQWYVQVYARAHWGQYLNGILGRNAAIRRDALKAVGEFTSEVITGTDYFLAKCLIKTGYLIYSAKTSVVETNYPETVREYWRHNTRWIRNLVIHGIRFKAFNDVIVSIIPSILGIVMIVGPFLEFLLGPIAIAGWLLVWLHVLLSRLRYIYFGTLVTDFPFQSIGYYRLPWYIFLDFLLWSWVLFQYPIKSLKNKW